MCMGEGEMRLKHPTMVGFDKLMDEVMGDKDKVTLDSEDLCAIWLHGFGVGSEMTGSVLRPFFNRGSK